MTTQIILHRLRILSLLVVLSTALSLSHAAPVKAAGEAISTGAFAHATIATASPINGVSITGTGNAQVPVKLQVASGSLQMTTTSGLTFTGGSSGNTLYFKGTRTDVNAALATLQYTRGSAGSDSLDISLVDYGQVFYPANGHLYEYVTGALQWGDANTAASQRTKYGATGYLATVTSQAENDFINARLTGAGWMGGSDVVTEGDWRWVTGPESGTQFWSGNGSGNTVNGGYAKWSVGEPNDSGGNEDCAQFGLNSTLTGSWNDLPCSNYWLAGYVVEYGTPGNLPTVPTASMPVYTATAGGDNDGIATSTEDSGPNGGDADNDGTPDSLQSHVANFTNPQTTHAVALAVNSACDLSAVSSSAASVSPAADSGYTYPDGMLDFTANCGTPGYTTAATLYYFGTSSAGLQLRKYNPVSHSYSAVSGAVLSDVIVGGQAATKAVYSLTDGGSNDADGTANGVIVDPVGLAQVAAASVGSQAAANTTGAVVAATTLVDTGSNMLVADLSIAACAGALTVFGLVRHRRKLR